jgi:hypothetical protein
MHISHIAYIAYVSVRVDVGDVVRMRAGLCARLERGDCVGSLCASVCVRVFVCECLCASPLALSASRTALAVR